MLTKIGIKVADAMTHRPIHILPDASLVECAKKMKENHISSLIVKDSKGKLLGLLTERDIIRKAVATDLKPGDVKASDVMVENLITVAPNEDLVEAMALMRDYEIRHIPVKKSDKLYGLVTIKDVLKVQPQLMELMIDNIHLKEENRKPIWQKSDGNCQNCGEYKKELKLIEGTLTCIDCFKET